MILQQKVDRRWSHNLAYAIGLITADGSLNADGRHIYFVSADEEMVENLKKALSITNKIIKARRGQFPRKKYFVLSFGDKVFYKFLNDIGIEPNKSKIIKKVDIPQKYFADFLRGLFDGDGTFYTFWDKRWPGSFAFKMSFASASPVFVRWLKGALVDFYGTKGYIHRGDGVENLEYTKGDSRKLFAAMYKGSKFLFLARKYNKIKSALKKDDGLGIVSLQKQRTPR